MIILIQGHINLLVKSKPWNIKKWIFFLVKLQCSLKDPTLNMLNQAFDSYLDR